MTEDLMKLNEAYQQIVREVKGLHAEHQALDEKLTLLVFQAHALRLRMEEFSAAVAKTEEILANEPEKLTIEELQSLFTRNDEELRLIIERRDALTSEWEKALSDVNETAAKICSIEARRERIHEVLREAQRLLNRKPASEITQ